MTAFLVCPAPGSLPKRIPARVSRPGAPFLATGTPKGDAAQLTALAREIFLAHDWVVLHLNGSPWFVQPPLYFWLAAICAKNFGVTSFALRLPAALATIAMGAMTAYAVARQVGMRAGIYASLILSTCLMQAIVGRAPLTSSAPRNAPKSPRQRRRSKQREQ